MDVRDCGLEFIKPRFHDIGDLPAIARAFARDRLVFVDNCDEDSLLRLGKYFGSIVKPRNEAVGGTGISNIRAAPGLVGKGYSSEELFFHTDRSGWDNPPQILITALHKKSRSGGESVFADGHAVIDAIRSKDPDLYRLITSSKFSSFKADSGHFEPRPIFDHSTSRLRFRFDDGIQLSASLVDRFQDLKKYINSHSFSLSLEVGQSYIVDNNRFLHARTSFSGERSLYRVLVQPHPPTMPKLVLFDIDGTLCSASALSVDAYYRCISSLVGRPITHEATPINLHGVTDKSLLKAILTHHGLSEGEISAVSARFYQAYPEFLAESVKRGFQSELIPGVLSTLEWIRSILPSSGAWKVGLLTGNYRAGAEFKLRSAGIDINMFDEELSSFGDTANDRHELVRNALAAWTRAQNASEGSDIADSQLPSLVNPGNVLVVGDTPLDVESAKTARCHVLAVSTGAYTSQQLQALGPDRACERLDSQEARDYITGFLMEDEIRAKC